MAFSKTRRTSLLVKLVLLFVAVVIFLGLLFPGSHVGNGARVAMAKNDETQIATAIEAFYLDYGSYPCNKNNGDDSKNYFVAGGIEQARLLNILRMNGDDPRVAKLNPRKTIYMDVPMVKDSRHPRNGIGPDGVWYDPWGNPYLIKIDSNENGKILNPYSVNAGPAELKAGVIVWSLRPDGKGATFSVGNGDKNSGINLDDVISWQ